MQAVVVAGFVLQQQWRGALLAGVVAARDELRVGTRGSARRGPSRPASGSRPAQVAIERGPQAGDDRGQRAVEILVTRRGRSRGAPSHPAAKARVERIEARQGVALGGRQQSATVAPSPGVEVRGRCVASRAPSRACRGSSGALQLEATAPWRRYRRGSRRCRRSTAARDDTARRSAAGWSRVRCRRRGRAAALPAAVATSRYDAVRPYGMRAVARRTSRRKPASVPVERDVEAPPAAVEVLVQLTARLRHRRAAARSMRAENPFGEFVEDRRFVLGGKGRAGPAQRWSPRARSGPSGAIVSHRTRRR